MSATRPLPALRALIAGVVALAVLGAGCAAHSYRIPREDLRRLAATAPEARGQEVRVVQEIRGTEAPAAAPVHEGTEIVIIPHVTVTRTYGPRDARAGGSPGGGRYAKGGGGGGGGDGTDAKAAAVVVLTLAAFALFAVAGIQGSRFDGWARLHPMHPVHLIGRDGGYTVMPLAWIDPETAAWADRAVVRPSEGPWLTLRRAPLSRRGATYSMYGGAGSLRSAHGELGVGPAFTVQLGYFPTQQLGVVGSVYLGWRENRQQETLFQSRYTLELQALPLAAGPLHAGLYGGVGAAYRAEDGVRGGTGGSRALAGGALIQLDIHTRLALTARLGVASAHEEATRELLVGLAVY
jgi:hypothetical protein